MSDKLSHSNRQLVSQSVRMLVLKLLPVLGHDIGCTEDHLSNSKQFIT